MERRIEQIASVYSHLIANQVARENLIELAVVFLVCPHFVRVGKHATQSAQTFAESLPLITLYGPSNVINDHARQRHAKTLRHFFELQDPVFELNSNKLND